MNAHKKAVAIAEHARELMEATADVAGEKVTQARNLLGAALAHGEEVYGQAKRSALRQVKAGDKLIRKNPYAALGIGVAVGVLIGILMRSSDRD